MAYETILYDVRDHILTVTLNRPEKLNAIFARGPSLDACEGVKSFFEKRPAKFPNRVSKDMPLLFPWWPERKYS